MGIRSVSHWIVFSLVSLVIAACGGDKGASNTPPVTIEGVWVQTEVQNLANRAVPVIIPVPRYQSTIVVKGNTYSFYEGKKEAEKGELKYDGMLHTTTNGKTHSDPVHTLTHDTLIIGDGINNSVYKRASPAEFNQYLGPAPQSENILPNGVPSAPDGAESLEGFWALKESREAALFVPAKPGELIFKVVNGHFESFKNGKLSEQGSISFNGTEIVTVSELGRIVSKVKSFGPKRGLKIEEETDGKLKGKLFKRITEEEFNLLLKGEEPPKPAETPPAEPKEDGEPVEEPTTEPDSNEETEAGTTDKEGDLS